MSWDSKQYLKFQKERTQPSIDLADRLTVQSPERIIDIGCGPGNSTAVLKKRYPDAEVIGADNSENMISAAKEKYPDIDFLLCDASKELGNITGKFDIVFSNACIQWVPDHPKLLREMLSLLKEGGSFSANREYFTPLLPKNITIFFRKFPPILKCGRPCIFTE